MSYAFIKSSPNPLSWAALKQPVKKHAKQNTYPHKGFKEVQLETGVFFPTVVNYRQNVAGEASKEYYFEFPAKAKQQQEQAVKWTWNMTVYFSHNPVHSEICCCECVCMHRTAEMSQECSYSGVPVLTHTPGSACTDSSRHYLPHHGCRWFQKKLWFSIT